MLDRVAGALHGLVDEIVLVANEADAHRWLPDARVVRDEGDRRGSLIGLRPAHQAALQAAPDGDALVVAWDMPFVTRDVLGYIQSTLAAPVFAAVPEVSGRVEPLCAAYSARCLDVVARQLEEDDLRLHALVDRLPVVRRIGERELAAFGDPERLFFNVNTAGDLAAAERMTRGD
jgi:molybdopterin-guanine dinucleotide biosynthesis protein A